MKLIYLVGEVTIDAWKTVVLFIKDNVRNFAKLLEIALPFIMYLIGQNVALERQKFLIGGEIIIPIAITIVAYYARQIANKIGKGTSFPVPAKRFTSEDEDGEVSVEMDRVQEMLLYVNDVENWLTRHGHL